LGKVKTLNIHNLTQKELLNNTMAWYFRVTLHKYVIVNSEIFVH